MFQKQNFHFHLLIPLRNFQASGELTTSIRHAFQEFNFAKIVKVCVKKAKNLHNPLGREFQNPLAKHKRAPDGEWYCCANLLNTIRAARDYAPENRTLLSMAQSLATRSLAKSLGNSYGEPQPGERYVMLRITRNLGAGKTIRRYFLVDDDQIPQPEGKATLMGRTTWCRIAEDLGDLVGSLGGFGNGVFKIECNHCGSFYHMRYHVSELACTNTGNGMIDSRRASWI